jgi:SYP7 family syntaxin
LFEASFSSSPYSGRLSPAIYGTGIYKVKRLSSEEYVARNDLALALPDRIQDIPDGGAPAPKQTGGRASSAS